VRRRDPPRGTLYVMRVFLIDSCAWGADLSPGVHAVFDAVDLFEGAVVMKSCGANRGMCENV
jgi:hypothetical protein